MDNFEDASANHHILYQVTEIVSAYVSNNPVATTDLPPLIVDIHRALLAVSTGLEPVVEELKPAVSIRKSVTPAFIVCLDDGKQFKSLKRHLRTLGMTPDEYRAKWGLPPDYPMVASNYYATQSALAKSIGLGRKPEAPMVPTRPAKKSRANA